MDKSLQPTSADVDAIVIGAGFAGLGVAHQLREIGVTVRGFETAGGVGGTWYWNRYPGARTDSKAYIYCYTFSKEIRDEWDWTELYPTQPEVLAYLEFVADRLDLRGLFTFNTTVTSVTWDDHASRWTVETDRGEKVTARFVVTAVGILSAVNLPGFDGIDSYAGQIVHTSRWPHEGVDFVGKRVAIIGSGSSGVQLLPNIVDDAASVTMLQRTPNYVSPGSTPPLSDDDRSYYRDNHEAIQELVRANPLFQAYTLAGMSAKATPEDERTAVYERAWQEGGLALLMATYADLLVDIESNRTLTGFFRRKIESTVTDPEKVAKLIPTHPYGVKRPPSSAGYYEVVNRETVDLVDLRATPIERFTKTGAVIAGEERPFDIVVFATGFDAITGAVTRLDIHGVDGTSIADKWADGPLNYLGMAMPGFPNLFTVAGPMVPAGNVPSTTEQNGQWIAGIIEHARAVDADRVEVSENAAAAWRGEVVELFGYTLVHETGEEANTWFMGANIEGKTPFPLFYFGPAIDYVNRCADEAAANYPNFDFISPS
jgi:cation diffusion facilitator CzcD-associated flavoprotein CzcO